ncbi:MAG TPA: hypothetical protein P5262_00395 [Candidatus Moranbacteria bacterium]|nr:hypothetical protein [Candidatus Moranbacteria bacterium]
MKIMIIDDTNANLEAARTASANFSEHEFSFFSSAKEAADKLEDFDAIISDLFFPNENHHDGSNLDDLYAIYRSEMDHPVFNEIVDYYYGGDWKRANGKLQDAVALLEEGTIRKAIERLIRFFYGKGDAWGLEKAKEYEERLESLPDQQFPYGGALILEAKKVGKACCLVSDIHRHAGEYKDAVGAIDAMTLLIPLMGAGIVTIEQAQYDGKNSLTYIGNDELYKTAGSQKKNSPKVWVEAIKRVLSQIDH